MQYFSNGFQKDVIERLNLQESTLLCLLAMKDKSLTTADVLFLETIQDDFDRLFGTYAFNGNDPTPRKLIFPRKKNQMILGEYLIFNPLQNVNAIVGTIFN